MPSERERHARLALAYLQLVMADKKFFDTDQKKLFDAEYVLMKEVESYK